MAWGLAWGLGGCLDPSARPCEDDEECRLDGRLGACEVDGYCAYPNADCPSGRRYGPFAANANACIPDCETVSPDLPCAEDPTCPESCERGDPVVLATWSRPAARLELRGLSVGASGRIAITGAIDEQPLLVLLDADGSVVRDDVALEPLTQGRAVAMAPDGTVWVALETSDAPSPASRVSVLRLDAGGDVQGGVGFATLGAQRVVGMEVDDTSAATLGGVLDGRPWLERRTTGDVRVFEALWSSDAPSPELVDLAVSRGGRVAVVGTHDGGGDNLWLFDPDGALALDVDLQDLGLMTSPGAVDLGGSAAAIVGAPSSVPWVAVVDDEGALRWSMALEGVDAVLDVALDDRGRATVIGLTSRDGALATWVEQRDASGEPLWQRRLPPEAGRPVAVALDGQQRPVVLGLAPLGDALWVRRFEP